MTNQKRPIQASKRAMEVLEYIEGFIKKNKYAPSIREIGEACKINSTSVVAYYLNRLEEEGFIEHEENKQRTIRLRGQRIIIDSD